MHKVKSLFARAGLSLGVLPNMHQQSTYDKMCMYHIIYKQHSQVYSQLGGWLCPLSLSLPTHHMMNYVFSVCICECLSHRHKSRQQ